MPLSAVLKQLPKPLHETIRYSPFCTSKSDSIVISSDDSRKQSDNVLSCEAKLNRMVIEAGRSAIPGETSAETIARVRDM